ncbi:putative zinc-binding metallopeptidase [Chitinophaga filiformis]|uniref:zinc-binding metallopeptidase n=1 Tax=Chitinophaga filiformis TaxID=104663 RepID=UPI001F212383|nr:putative zinc-binding metallopeptidase [Chitinophaga filiformis]MCF6402616.1 putative zinc-binding metallopeptidase [Chitinophaga filiformis]MCF6403466.1 putative zinc-binding metallopeptidase [Chitinophaga filiformis]
MKHIKIFFLLFAMAVLAACSKGDDDLSGVQDIPGLGGDTWVPGSLDAWLHDTMTVPYNIEVKYKWDQFEFDVTKTLVPPREEVVVPAIRAIKKVWIDNYINAAGEIFFKKYSPKFFILSGSASWNDNGTITLGTAEGGRKVVMYLLNDFRTKDMPGYTKRDTGNVKQIFHVIEHEFGHILHQTKMYPPEFKKICAGYYTGNWNNIADTTARKDGFVTAYAMSNENEDFVEMISMMLIEGKAGFDRIVNSIPEGYSVNGSSQAQAKDRLRQKEAMVVNYFKAAYNIDFYSLQDNTRKSIVQLLY